MFYPLASTPVRSASTLPRFPRVARSGSCPTFIAQKDLAIVATSCNLWTWKDSKDQRKTFGSCSKLPERPAPERPRLWAQSQPTLWRSAGSAKTSLDASRPRAPNSADGSKLGFRSPSSPTAELSSKTSEAEGAPVRVAVVGAGPVGLWIAVVLARAHAKFFHTSGGFRISRLPHAPLINVTCLKTGWIMLDPQIIMSLELIGSHTPGHHRVLFLPTAQVFEQRSDSGWGTRTFVARSDLFTCGQPRMSHILQSFVF